MSPPDVGTPGPWEGAQFLGNLGIWYHPTWYTTGTYSGATGNMEVESWSYRRQGWFDRSYQPTTKVSEPGTLVLFGIALTLLAVTSRRRPARVVSDVVAAGATARPANTR